MPNFETKNFQPETTKDANIEKREYWLNKAVGLETDGRSEAMVNMALNKAHDYERAALNY